MPFVDRMEAGRRLGKALAAYEDQHPIILALPRGGVPVAGEIAAMLGAPLDLVLVRKIGVPLQPELAMGAVADGPEPLVVRNEDVIALSGVDRREFNRVRDQELAEIARRRQRYLGKRPHPDLNGQVAIVVDDGVATGATTKAALRAVRMQNPKKLVLAVPVAPTDTLSQLKKEADEIVCLEDYEPFGAIGAFYADFNQVSDEQVTQILARFPPQSPAEPAASGEPPPS